MRGVRGARAQAWALGERACYRHAGRGARRWASGRRAGQAGTGARGARGLGARGLALGSALGPFSILFDSAHFRSVLTRFFS